VREENLKIVREIVFKFGLVEFGKLWRGILSRSGYQLENSLDNVLMGYITTRLLLGQYHKVILFRKFLFPPPKFLFFPSENFGKCFPKFFLRQNSSPPPKNKVKFGRGDRNYIEKNSGKHFPKFF
jgi:hypothetical protein